MDTWNAKYKNKWNEYEVKFCSDDYEKAKAVERVCQYIIDGEITSRSDVAPVRRGYWKSKVNPQWKAYSHDECSICGWWNTRNAMCYDGNHKPGHSLNYCPNCGAEMKRVEK